MTQNNEKASPLPWHLLMRLGLGQLGLTPDQFWRMTLREFKAALEGRFGQGLGQTLCPPMERENLLALINKYPDRRQNSHKLMMISANRNGASDGQ